MSRSEDTALGNRCLRMVGAVRRRHNRARFVEALAGPALIAATGFTLMNLMLPHWRSTLALLASLAALLAAAVRSVGQWISFQQAAAQLDRQTDAQGLLLTALERPLGPWNARLIKAIESFRVHSPTPWRALGLISLALVGACVTALLPPLDFARPQRANETAQHAIAEVEARRNEQPFEPEVSQALDRLKHRADEGQFGEAEWQSLDFVTTRLNRQALVAAEALSTAAQAAEALAQAETLQTQAEQREALERALLAVSPNQPGVTTTHSRTASPAAAYAFDGGVHVATPADAKALAAALKARKEALLQRLSPSAGGTSQTPSSAGAGFDRGMGAAVDVGAKTAPGTGGGKSASALTFLASPDLHPERLAFASLPVGQGGPADIVYGLVQADPSVSKTPVPTRPSFNNAPQEASATLTSPPLSPRGRAVVERFFAQRRR
jgi:hypothetical protein